MVAAAAGSCAFALAWPSRSGPPPVPWLAPAVPAPLPGLAGAGLPAVLVCPLGFVAAPLAVVWALAPALRFPAAAAGL
ncbi:ferrochelatase, partial [Mycobacterium tuberculosis]|uniref:ferrochelatase n=1 Tax=Mycobacterium tuberculosis TaxID=1773 RepID=UPI003C6DBB55